MIMNLTWNEWLWNRRVEYWAIRSSVHSFTRIAHSFACSAPFASLARSAVLIHSVACSLTHSGGHGKVTQSITHSPPSHYPVTYPVTTTTKSMMFHIFLKYDPGWRTNPRATILSNDSTQKMARKYTSVSSCRKKKREKKIETCSTSSWAYT